METKKFIARCGIGSSFIKGKVYEFCKEDFEKEYHWSDYVRVLGEQGETNVLRGTIYKNFIEVPPLAIVIPGIK